MHVDMTKRTHLVIAPPETAIKQHNSVVPQQIVKQTCVTSEIHKDKFDGYVGMTNSKKKQRDAPFATTDRFGPSVAAGQ